MIDSEEWEQLDTLRKELNSNLMAYNSEAQEKFTELFVKSLEGKRDLPVQGTVFRTSEDGLPPFRKPVK